MTNGDSPDGFYRDDAFWTPFRLAFGAVLLGLTALLLNFQWPKWSLGVGVELTQFWINCSAIYAVIFERKAIKRFFVRILIWYRTYLRQAEPTQSPNNQNQILSEPPKEPHSRRSAGADAPPKDERDLRWVAPALFICAMVALVLSGPQRRAGGSDRLVVPPEATTQTSPESTPSFPSEQGQNESDERFGATRSIERRSGEYCWDLAVRCAGNGNRWLELAPLNPGLYRNENTCDVEDDNLALEAPADWNCI